MESHTHMMRGMVMIMTMMGVMVMRMTYMLLHRRHDWTVGLSGSQSENEENEYIVNGKW